MQNVLFQLYAIVCCPNVIGVAVQMWMKLQEFLQHLQCLIHVNASLVADKIFIIIISEFKTCMNS